MEIRPKYTVGCLELYYEITGEDLLFQGGNVDTPLKRKAFIYAGINGGSGDKITMEEINNLSLKQFTDYFVACLNVFNESFGEDVKESVGDKKVKKN